ncbi:MAG: 50S ribosomal protein L11 [Candidatus Altiarchaeales archaeon]|nr:50S ribosomal protein L11 [Candidatus Altiarchaeales archaeon]
MTKETIEVLVEGGNANPGPPLGPSIGPMGLDINAVVGKINEKTSDMKGMKVPVKLIIDPQTKEYEIKVGSPPVSALIKKELGVEKGSTAGETVGNLDMDQVMKLMKIKRDSLLANDDKCAVKEILGVCQSMGVTIEGKNAKETTRAVDEGKFDQYLNKES